MSQRAASVLLIASLAACAAPRYQGQDLDPVRLGVMRQEIKARLAASSADAATNKPARAWGEPEISAIFEDIAQAAKPLCETEKVQCRFNLHIPDETTDVNAYASGAGDVTITRELLRHLASDDQLAFVLGHEVGHHLGEHMDEQQVASGASAALGAVVLGAIVAAVGGDPDMVAGGATLGAAAGAGTLAMRYSLTAETEADYIGSYLTARAGYDPDAGREVMMVFADVQGSGSIEQSFFDSHPSNPERVVANERATAEIAAKRAAGEPLLPTPRP